VQIARSVGSWLLPVPTIGRSEYSGFAWPYLSCRHTWEMSRLNQRATTYDR
jgi:hypothetical protein